MFDSHAHIGQIEYNNGLVCSASPSVIPIGYKYQSVGLISQSNSNQVDLLEDFASKGYFIGEIGLDKRYQDIDKQLMLFNRALSIAKKYNSFVTIHQVGYPELIFNSLKKHKINNFLIHGYTGSYEMAKRFISLGGLISLGPRCEKAKSFSKLIELDFVTETDMPMSKEEDIMLKTWNTRLSELLDKNIEAKSEKLIMERLNV